MSDLRVGGLISGTDARGIIDKILAVRARPILSHHDEIDQVNEKISAWSEINTKMTALTDVTYQLRQWNAWNQMQAVSSDTARMTATATTAAVEGIYNIAIDRLAQAHSVASDRADTLHPGATATTDLVEAGILTAGDEFTIEGQTITIGATESLTSLRDKLAAVNAEIPAANRFRVMIMDQRLVITRTNTGTREIDLAETVGSPLQALRIFDAPDTYKADNVLMAAQDAQFTVNGAVVNRANNTQLTDVLPGLTLNLHATTFTSITLTVGRDKESAKASIMDFIDKYNEAAAKMMEYSEVFVSSDGAGGSRIGTQGILSNDTLVREILSNMRKYAMESKFPHLNQVNASYTYNGRTGICNSLQDIGIGTISRENRLEVMDEKRLDYMLEHNFDKVEQLFRGVQVENEGYRHGVASDFNRYSDSITALMTGAIARRNSRLNSQVRDIEGKIEQLERVIDQEEQRLWAQFGAMEDAIARMQSQLAYLTGQLGMR